MPFSYYTTGKHFPNKVTSITIVISFYNRVPTLKCHLIHSSFNKKTVEFN